MRDFKIVGVKNIALYQPIKKALLIQTFSQNPNLQPKKKKKR